MIDDSDDVIDLLDSDDGVGAAAAPPAAAPLAMAVNGPLPASGAPGRGGGDGGHDAMFMDDDWVSADLRVQDQVRVGLRVLEAGGGGGGNRVLAARR